MKIPTFPKLNYAMHLLGACFVELFPKVQLLDLVVHPDRFCVDFSFSRALTCEEIILLKNRFFEKIKNCQKADVREMVSKNACDLLKHYKQFFLTKHVDREEMFTNMLCMDLYNAPLKGPLEQDLNSIKELVLELVDLGQKKWMKRKIFHYRMDASIFFEKADAKRVKQLNQSNVAYDHQTIGDQEGLFWVKNGNVFFTEKGESLYQDLASKATSYFGELVYFTGSEKDFFKVSRNQLFSITKAINGNYKEICYGLKQTNTMRSIISYNFSNKDSKVMIKNFIDSIGLNGEFTENGNFVLCDYKGIFWDCVKLNNENKYMIIEVNLQRIFAFLLENKNK